VDTVLSGAETGASQASSGEKPLDLNDPSDRQYWLFKAAQYRSKRSKGATHEEALAAANWPPEWPSDNIEDQFQALAKEDEGAGPEDEEPTDEPEAKPKREGDALSLVCMADVEPEEVEFLWRPYIPISKLTNIEGDPEGGKSTLSLQIAAAVSKGGMLHKQKMVKGKVLLLSAEDGLADTVRPRLDRAGADCKNVIALDKHFAFDKEGLRFLDWAIGEVGPDLVVIDPIVAYTGDKVDMYRANHVRKMMKGLADLAEAHGCAIVIVRHFKKSNGGRALHQGAGSIDFTAAPRSVLIIAADPEEPNKRVMAHSKCNIAKKGPSLTFTIEDGGLVWGEESDRTADDLMVEHDEEAKARRSDTAQAKDICRAVLARGDWVPSAVLIARAAEDGISERSLRRARSQLGVEVEQRADGWWCRLARKAA
jgi:AAA domain